MIKKLDKLNAYFAMNWARVPFQPILFLFIFAGASLVIIFDVDYPAFDDNARLFWQWIALSILCPPLALLAWILIRWFPGRPRYVGFWIRFGADVGQFASISTFLAVVSGQVDHVASELYAAVLFAAVWWFVIVLIIRDVWKLVLTEHVANVIEEQKAGDDGDR